jgi:hypothetical protein
MRLAKAKIQGASLVHLDGACDRLLSGNPDHLPCGQKGRGFKAPHLPFSTSHRLFIA